MTTTELQTALAGTKFVVYSSVYGGPQLLTAFNSEISEGESTCTLWILEPEDKVPAVNDDFRKRLEEHQRYLAERHKKNAA
jgi:hypothetical protein